MNNTNYSSHSLSKHWQHFITCAIHCLPFILLLPCHIRTPPSVQLATEISRTMPIFGLFCCLAHERLARPRVDQHLGGFDKHSPSDWLTQLEVLKLRRLTSLLLVVKPAYCCDDNLTQNIQWPRSNRTSLLASCWLMWRGRLHRDRKSK